MLKNNTQFKYSAFSLALAASFSLSSPSVLANGLTGQAIDHQEEMEHIVVTASRKAQSIKNAPASITLITREELQRNSVNDIASALGRVEGIDVNNGRGKTGGLSISLRGMPSEYTLILVDGRRQNVAGNVTPNGFGDTAGSFMPPMSAIESIEVIRGPMSTLYGSDAMGGVINIITRAPDGDWKGQLTLDSMLQSDSEFGDKRSANFYLNGPLAGDNLSIALRGSYHERDESTLSFKDKTGEQQKVSSFGASPVEGDRYSLGAKLAWHISDKQKLWLDLDTSEQAYNNDEGQIGRLGKRGYGPELKFSRDQFVLAHDIRLGEGSLISDYSVNTTTTQGRILPNDVAGTTRKTGDARFLEATNKIFNSYYSGEYDDHNFTLGVQHWDAELKDGVIVKPLTHTQWAIFAENEWRIVDELGITFGGRHDDHDVFGSHFSPRLYTVWNTTDKLTIKGGIAGGFRTPQLDEISPGLIGWGGQGTIPLVGSPDLKPETSINYELGASYYSDKFNLSAALFYNKFEDKISRGPHAKNCAYGVSKVDYQAGSYNKENCIDAGYFDVKGYWDGKSFIQSINIDEAVTKGLELSGKFTISEDIDASLNYTHTKSEQKTGRSAGDPLTNTPEHIINANISWHINDNLSTWFSSQYNSERYRAAGWYPAAQKALGDYKSYALFDLGGNYQFNDEIRLTMTIYNLFDKDFVDYAPYETTNRKGEPVTQYSNQYVNPLEGRRLWLSLSYEF